MQWDIEKIWQKTTDSFIAGDDDQAVFINGRSGRSFFINLEGKKGFRSSLTGFLNRYLN